MVNMIHTWLKKVIRNLVGTRSGIEYFSLLTRDSPTPVWHLSSLTPEKSTSWTPSKYADVVIYQNQGKPKNRDDSGEILTAMLFESFLSYQTHEGRLAL